MGIMAAPAFKQGKTLTGFPSLDMPWNVHYTQEMIDTELPKTTFCNYVRERTKALLDNTALIYFGTKINYRQFFENVEQAARGLTALGVKKGDIVTIFSSNTPETVYCIFALNMLGAIPSMEYVTVTDSEAVAAVRHCESKVVLVLDVLLSKFETLLTSGVARSIVALPLVRSMPKMMRLALGIKSLLRKEHYKGQENVIYYGDMIENGKGAALVEAPFEPETPAIIVHSGGTTGTPKGVLLSNEGLNYVAWGFTLNSAEAKDSDRYMAYIPLFHAFGMGMGLMAPMIHGMAVVLSPKFDECFLLSNFRKYKPNHIMCSSSHMAALMHDPIINKMDLSFLKTCGFGGSKLPEVQEIELEKFLGAHNSIAKPSAGYGMSELSSAIASERNCFYGKVGSVGLPLCRANVKVLDIDSGKELRYGEAGELCFSSPGLMLGYYKNPKETEAAIFTDESGVRWLHSGDLGYVDEDGFIFITGRLKRIYSTRAGKGGTMFKIFPDYVANVIDEATGVHECAVVCIEHPDYKSAAVAYVVVQEGYEQEAVRLAIEKHMADVLPSHCVPKVIRFIDALPLTQIGKVDFKLLEKDAEGLGIK